MDTSTALLTHRLDHLTTVLVDTFVDDDGSSVAATLAALDAALAAAVASYGGMQLTLAGNGGPVVVSVFRHHRVDASSGPGGRDRLVTSLRLPLALLDPTFHAGSRIVFYATSRGAFTDLAADLSYALTPRTGHSASHTLAVAEHGRPASPQLRLCVDTDPPPPHPTTGITGLAERATINQAAGVLISRGHHPDDVEETLRRQASVAGQNRYNFAIHLLEELVDSRATSASWPSPPQDARS